MVAGMLLQAVGLAWFALMATDTVGYASLVVPLIVAGIGISMAIPTTPAAALSAVAPVDIGKASGTNSTLQRFGGAFGIAVATAVFTAKGHLAAGHAYDAGFRPALAAAAGMSLLGAGCALLVRARPKPVPQVAGPEAPAPVPAG
jgi:MFS family permease